MSLGAKGSSSRCAHVFMWAFSPRCNRLSACVPAPYLCLSAQLSRSKVRAAEHLLNDPLVMCVLITNVVIFIRTQQLQTSPSTAFV